MYSKSECAKVQRRKRGTPPLGTSSLSLSRAFSLQSSPYTFCTFILMCWFLKKYDLFEFYCNHQLNEFNHLRVLIHAQRCKSSQPAHSILFCADSWPKKEFLRVLRKQGTSPQYEKWYWDGCHLYLGLVILVHWNFPLSLARVFAFHSKFVPTTASIDNDS